FLIELGLLKNLLASSLNTWRLFYFYIMDTLKRARINDLFEDCQRKSQKLRLTTEKERRHKLRKLEKWILQNRGTIQKAVYADLKKPKQETDLTEIFVVLSEIRKARRNLRLWMAPKKVSGGIPYLGTKAYTYPEPMGCCLIISPWNYPFQLAVSPLVSAIAAGNSVIIKPSEFSEYTSTLIKKMCEDLFDKDEIGVVLGAVNESKELLSLPFNHIFFTGSPRVGKVVMEAAVKHLASVTLELGGKSPAIVDETASIKDAAKKIAWGKWQNAGQVCVAPDYLLIHEQVKDRLVEELVVQSNKIYGDEKNYGSIINREHHNRINDMMADAIERGATLEFGGKSDRTNLRFSPTLLSKVSRDSRIMNDEIFGPILPLVTFSTLEEAVDLVNEKEKPLSLYVFSNKRKNIQRIKKETSSGMMTINDTVLQFAHTGLPIGGVNHSGIGKAHGYHGFLAFSNEKAILKQRIGLTMAKTVYPPFTKLKNWLIDFMIKYI
ncbi:MAG: aldehyde dehydrogenase family protein, partial [Bacteroidota bacterium]